MLLVTRGVPLLKVCRNRFKDPLPARACSFRGRVRDCAEIGIAEQRRTLVDVAELRSRVTGEPEPGWVAQRIVVPGMPVRWEVHGRDLDIDRRAATHRDADLNPCRGKVTVHQ